MRFTTTVTFIILAGIPIALAVPTWSAPALARAEDSSLSLTAKLFLADTAVDRFALLPDDKQFVFDFNTPQANPGKGGELVAANRKTFPALVGTGSGMAVGRIKPCGMNTLHVHPRATELQVVTKGRLVTAMTPENGVNKDGKRRVVQNTLIEYQMTPFYQGSVHTQFNPDCTDTIFVASFNSEDFGAGQIADETFAFGDDILGATFGQSLDGAEIDKVRAAIPASIAKGVEQCLMKCNIPKRSV